MRAAPIPAAAVITARRGAPSAAAVTAFDRLAPHGPGALMARYTRTRATVPAVNAR